MQKKHSGVTILFALFCLGGIFALLSQTEVRRSSARGSNLGTLDPPSSTHRILESEMRGPMLRGPMLLDPSKQPRPQKRCCKQGPLFD